MEASQPNIAGIITNLILWISSIIGLLGILGILPLLYIGIKMIVKSSSEEGPSKKESDLKKGIICIILPFVMIFGALIITIAIKAIQIRLGI
jgi:threonine/homoserine/homoserine lactone efflux protein